MKKLLYIDTETTGLDPVKNDVIQIAGILGRYINKFDRAHNALEDIRVTRYAMQRYFEIMRGKSKCT